VNEPGDWLVYVRRSYKRVDDADISDEQQEKSARSLVPKGAHVEVIRDSGGHQSGASAERDGYRHLQARVASGSVKGIAVYDLSRLARNAGLMLPLKAELEKRSIPIRVATMPDTKFDGAIGRYMFGQLALAAQLQRDLDSERMVGLTRTIYENGGHRGLDPFGYRTVRDAVCKVVKPRTLEIVDSEAAVVRRVWRDVLVMSADDVYRGLQRDGVKRRTDEPWTPTP
jgi:DNA invertase Pin-like site-specific DNA recombinase